MKWSNYHQHNHFDDGTKTVDEHVRSALEQGVVSMGFSGHCPVPFSNKWSIQRSDIDAYFKEIHQTKQKFEDRIQIYRSLEVDFIPGIINIHNPWIKSLHLDYTVGSVHFVGAYQDGAPWEIDGPHQHFLDGLDKIYSGDIQFVIKKYYSLVREMITSACPDIIGHLDKIKMQNKGFWNEDDEWYTEEVLNTLEEIKATDAIVEVNTRGIYKKLTFETYPGRWILEHIHKMDIPIQINSDAHHPSEITKEFQQTALLLKSIGFKHLWVFLDNEWQPVPFDENGLIIN